MNKEKLLEIAKKHFPEYEIVDIHYPKTPLEPQEYIVIKFNPPKGLYTTIEEYLKFYYELEKQTPFYPVFPISFQFANENDIVPEECQYIPVWTKDEKFLKEFYEIIKEEEDIKMGTKVLKLETLCKKEIEKMSKSDKPFHTPPKLVGGYSTFLSQYIVARRFSHLIEGKRKDFRGTVNDVLDNINLEELLEVCPACVMWIMEKVWEKRLNIRFGEEVIKKVEEAVKRKWGI